MSGPLVGAIEAGGTKFVCGVGTSNGGSLETHTVSTRDPEMTFAEIAHFFEGAVRHSPLAAIGIGTFGPVELDRTSTRFGQILRTAKPGWEGANLVELVKGMSRLPVAIDTDVNAAALAEAKFAATPVRNLAYVTVGTGIGVGIVIDGKPVHGLGHPEAGHLYPRRHPAHGAFPGSCPFHGDCYEGVASGVAINSAWGGTPSQLPQDHVFWEVEAYYLAQLCGSLFLTLAPEIIVLGGGVMTHRELFNPIRRHTSDLLAGYFAGATSEAEISRRIVPPVCLEPSGLIGSYMLAEQLLVAAG
jgi:fructokinase